MAPKCGVERLSVGPLMQCVLRVLQERFLRKHFGCSFLQILAKTVLTSHAYCMNISGDNWKELLSLTEEFYHSPANTIDKVLLLTTLTLIIDKGSAHSFLALEVKKKFKFATECIKAGCKTQNLQAPLANLALTMCRLLSYECRVAICKFGEEVMVDFIDMYDYYKGDGGLKKKDLLLDWFLLQVRVHHPGGVRRSSAVAYAHDADAWQHQLVWLYRLVTRELQVVVRYRTIRHLTDSFISLAIAVCRQMFDTDCRETLDMTMISLNDTSASFCEPGPSTSAAASAQQGGPKRIRLETGVAALLDKLSQSAQPDMWPWLTMLSALSIKHPDLISEGNLLSALQICSDQLQTCKDNNTSQNLFKCCKALLYVESRKQVNNLDTTRLKALWTLVWETSLRSVGLNVCEKFSHELVQALVLSSKEFAVDKLLKTYVSGAIHRSEHSLMTLYQVAMGHCIGDILNKEQCIILLDWVLPSREEHSIQNWSSILPCTELVAKVLVAITMKSKVPRDVKEQCEPEISPLERHYMITSFDETFDAPSKMKDTKEEKSQGLDVTTDVELWHELTIVLNRDNFAATRARDVPADCASVHTIALHISLVFNVITYVKMWRLSYDGRLDLLVVQLCDSLTAAVTSILQSKLDSLVTQSCDALTAAVTSVLQSRSDVQTVTSVLGRLVALFRIAAAASDVDPEASRAIAHRLGSNYIIKACRQLTVVSQRTQQAPDDADYDMEIDRSPNSGEFTPIDDGSVVGWSRVQLEAFKVMLEFGRWDSDVLTRLLETAVATNKEVSSVCALHMALAAANHVTSLPEINEDALEESLILLQDICRKWHASDLVTLKILQIFQDLCRHVTGFKDIQNNYTVLVSAILKYVKLFKYGAHVCQQYAKLLSHIAQADPSGEWSTCLSNGGSVRPIAHELLTTFLTSPFHQVRITACQVVSTLFSTSQQQQSQVFTSLLAAVNEVFLVQGDQQEEERLDEEICRISTVLHCLSAVTSITIRWRSQALFNIFALTVEKNINVGLVKKVLAQTACRAGVASLSELARPMLPALLWRWHEKHTALTGFPWALLGYDSEPEFLRLHLGDAVTVLVHRRDMKGLKALAAAIDKPIAVVVETCYPFIMASILPGFSDDHQQLTASVIISTIEEILGEDIVHEQLVTKMTDVITHLLANMHDVDNLKLLCGGTLLDLPEKTKLSFAVNHILGGIKHIQENSPKSDTPLFLYLSQEKPRLIQKVLLKLYSKIHKTTLPEYRLLYLHQLVTLCDMLAELVGLPQFPMGRYTVSWVVKALLHLSSSDVSLLAVSYLHRFLGMVLGTQAPVVDSILSDIITTLVPLADADSATGQQVLRVLELLLLSHSETLRSAAALDPLPEQPMFQHMAEQCRLLRYASPLSHSLEAEIQHSLNNGQEHYSIQGLKHLRKQLSDKKIELHSLYKELQDTRGFSEDSEKSILHQLICMLIKTTASSDPKARYEAACCLGELGPGELTTLGLRPEPASSSSRGLEPFLKCVLRHLERCLFDANVEVIQITSESLYFLFTNFNLQLKEVLTPEQTELFYPFIGLLPVPGHGKKQKLPVTVDIEKLSGAINMFCPDQTCSHKRWLAKLTEAILQTTQFVSLVPLCIIKENFCEELFPLAIDLFLEKSKDKKSLDLIIDRINEFFMRHNDNFYAGNVYNDRDSVLTMLKVVQITRYYIQQEMKINYLSVGKAALFCSAHFTSIMYAELWASEYNRNRKDLDLEGVTQLEYIEDGDKENGPILQNLLREAYMKLGEPDAVYGCGLGQLLEQTTLVRHYQHEGQWPRVVEAYDLQLSLHPDTDVQGFGSALHHCGLYHLAGRVSDRAYEASWRLGQWERPEPPEPEATHDGLMYGALRALTRDNPGRVLHLVRQARAQVALDLATTSLEAAINVYEPLARLQALQELEDFTTCDFTSVARKWEQQDKVGWNKFTLVETIMAQRMTMLRIKADLNPELIAQQFIGASEAARREGFEAVALSWLASLTHHHPLPPPFPFSVQLLQAQLYWDKQETYTARHILRGLLGKLKDSGQQSLYAKALQTYGSWVACSRTEQAQQIMDKYLIPAVEISDDQFKLTSAIALARYADSEYEALLNYVKSSAYTSKLKNISDSVTSAQRLAKAVEKTPKNADRQTRIDIQKSINMHCKQSKIDQTEVEAAQRELDNFLILAVKHYLLSLEMRDADNLCVFRVVSLWLNNLDHTELQEQLAAHLDQIPSYKVLPVLPQLVARIGDDTSETSTELLHNLIERCAKDHPHHVLPLILALANSHKDLEFTQGSLPGPAKPEARVTGAQRMLVSLKRLKGLINDMQRVADAYISLANCPHTADKSSKVCKIPKKQPITGLRSMDHILCPSVTLPVNKSGDYTNIIGILGFKETYCSAGGINMPKKISCICTDGITRPQLVKGNDDLRQDAVMQQVFTIMNSLLRENKETRHRRLIIRTYKIVPLSQRSGIIEWCVNTEPLATYLLGEAGAPGAHVRHRPEDWLPSICRHKLSEAGKSDNATKLAIYKQVCAHFKPVFRHFFFEKFPQPGIWFERKQAYIHSVATSSMVGYILGLGDRHVQNILLDDETAEVIHIDFGIAFEQGRTLVTPETVPFRLTRDIVDGMGVAGIEGVFRRSCEKTMEVLRESQQTIASIVEVLLYDPLYMWTITPAKAMALQSAKPVAAQSQPSQSGGEEQPVNKLAMRALQRLRQKLQGIEEGTATSIEGQVSKLIQEATNPANLCRLFQGWQAHV